MRKLSQIPARFVREMRARREKGETFIAIRDWMMSRGQSISPSGVFALCSDIPVWKNRREAVRARVKAGANREEAATAEGVSKTSAQRWCIDLPRAATTQKRRAPLS